MAHDLDNARYTLYPATIAMLSRHLAATSAAAGSGAADSRLSEALIALADLAASLGSPGAPRSTRPSLRDLMAIIDPLFALCGVDVALHAAPDSFATTDPRHLFALVHLLTRLAEVPGNAPDALTITVAEVEATDWVIEVTEHGQFSDDATRMLRADVMFARHSALLALHGARVQLERADPGSRLWRISAPPPLTDTTASASGANALIPPARARHRLAVIAPLRERLGRLKGAVADASLAEAAREIEALRRLAEAVEGLELGEIGHAAAMAAIHADAATLKAHVEAFEVALVRYVLGRDALQPHAIDLHAPTVLVVEPDAALRASVVECLGDDGSEVFACAGPEDAVALCRGAAPDLVVVAADLGGRDGLAAVCDLLACTPGRDPAVLVAIPAGAGEIAARALEAGAADVVDHPYHLPTVRHRVRRIVSAAREAAHAERLASVDHVTGLPNRAQFQSRLHQMLGESDTMADGLTLIFMDLNRFKLVNETMGHDVGDHVLRTIAARLREVMRPADGVVARLGSDEFAIATRGTLGRCQAEAIAEALIQRVSEPLRVARHEIYTSCTLGIARCADDTTTTADLMRHADSALFHARQHGLGYAFYETSMGSRATSRLTLEGDLRRALRGDQFELNFQPQIRLGNDRCEGAEALVRWRHPERGLVSPAEFVPLAEDTGLIVELGYWVLEEACRFVAELRRSAPGAALKRLSINLSSRQLDCPDLPERVERALARHAISGEDLEVEITESAVMKRGDTVLTTLKALKDLGIRIAIDDFGSGYCSFGYLKRFPIDVLKIDRSLISDIVDQSDDREIVRGIVALARALRLETVAEGVEAVEEITLLRQMGCDSVQGFYFSRPLPAAEFTAQFCAVSARAGADALPRLA